MQDIIYQGRKALFIEGSDFLTNKEEYTKTIDEKMAKLREEGYHYVLCACGLPAKLLPHSLLNNLYRETKLLYGWVNDESSNEHEELREKK